jgi:ADP-ribose pyrophosphatase
MPEHKDLTEHQMSSEDVFDGVLLKVRRDVVRLPDGSSGGREYIEHPGAVAILPILDSGEIVLERQFRYPLHRTMIEIPAGKIDAGEAPLATARRELLEETGYSARDWRHLLTFHPVIAYSTERIEIFLARGLTKQEARLDEGEFLEVFTAPLATALEWVRNGTITDSKTIIALMWLDKLESGGWPPAD